MKQFALHPGYVIAGDWDSHYISYMKLLRLYELDSRDCIEWDDQKPYTYLGRKKEDFIHLWTQDGKYKEHLRERLLSHKSQAKGES